MTLTENKQIKYRGSVVGKVRYFADKRIFVWFQDEFRYFSTEEKKAFGMSVGLLNKIQSLDFDFVEIEESMIPVSKIEDYEKLSRYADVFEDNPHEDQILVTVDK